MKTKLYPAVFTPEDGGYTVHFPDLKGCITKGDSLDEAFEMAHEALGLYLIDEDNVFKKIQASAPEDLSLEANQFIVIVEFDLSKYLYAHDTSAVKKTLTIPSWINQAALKKNINFSQTLSQALLDKLSE